MIKHKKSLWKFHLLATILFVFLAGCASKPAATSPQPQPTRDPNLEKTIESQLKKMNPAAIPVYQEATEAMDADNLEKSKQLYEQVLDLAPNFSTAYRRLGYIELNNKNITRAEELSRKALELESSPYNQTALAIVLLQKDTPKDSQEAFDLASAAVKSLPDDDQANTVLLMSAATINNLDVARQTDQHLLQLQPNSPYAHYMAGLLLASDQKWEQAESELLKSQELGMPAEMVQRALGIGISRNASFTRFLRRGAIGLVFWLLGFGALFLIGTYLSKATIQALNKTGSEASFQVKPEEQKVRSIYRVVVGALSLYFYISIPFVILSLLLVVGGAFYIFMLIGRFPIQLSLMLVLMLFASLFALARSLFSRVRDVPPGRPLYKKDAPELWTFVEDIAKKLNIRPVDSIYITPWTGIAVNEKGSILQKVRGGGKRNLILGMGVLPGLTQGQLAAIVAHEYGHFSNQDTAGGDLAHQVFASLHQMAQRLIQSGAALVYNPVWLFVMGYQRIFLRVTLGASRLQEVLADRYAAIAYGSENFIEGLRNVIRQSIAFPIQANYEVNRSLGLKQTVNNLYDLPVEEKLQGDLEKQFDEALKRATSQYDSHPAFQERIDWIERLRLPYSSMQDNKRPALHLFPNPEALQREMTAELMKNVKVQKS